ncbi:MAG: thioredoxin family protein [Gammaproteobacteria bacterium]|nr:thioredoxin family protein [Gammaproteobacteria bacterium]
MAALETPVCDFDLPAPAFDLPGVDGQRHSLQQLRGENGTLVMFICNHCPFVRSAIDRIIRDARDLASAGVNTIAIMSNDTEAYPADSFDNMVAWSREHEFPFPYLLDADQSVARAYGAVCTPDFFGYNADLGLQYRGRLDDGRTGQPTAGAKRELYEAMAAIAATGRGPAQQVPSIGCSLKWRDS